MDFTQRLSHLQTIGILSITLTLLASCTTIASATLDNRLQAIGLPPETASCMAGDLEQNLSQDDLIDLTRYTFSVASASGPVEIVRSLMEIDNPRAVTAIGNAGISCITSGFFR